MNTFAEELAVASLASGEPQLANPSDGEWVVLSSSRSFARN